MVFGLVVRAGAACSGLFALVCLLWFVCLLLVCGWALVGVECIQACSDSPMIMAQIVDSASVRCA